MVKINSHIYLLISIIIFVVGICFGIFICGQFDFFENRILKTEQIVEEYVGNWVENDSDFIDYLNNNSIDHKYSSRLISAETSADMSEIIGEWIQAYDEEISSATVTIKSILISNNKVADNEVVDNAIDAIQNYTNSFNAYMFHYSEFMLNCKLATSGYGTEVQPYVAFGELKKKRETLFEMAELIYYCTGEFRWKTGDGTVSSIEE